MEVSEDALLNGVQWMALFMKKFPANFAEQIGSNVCHLVPCKRFSLYSYFL
jgi:hypothetical protein